MWIYAYNSNSRSAHALAGELGARCIRHENSRFIGRPRKVVINWGSSKLPDEVHKSTVLNGSQRVAHMTNKLKFFELCKKSFRIPAFTTDQDVAETWRRSGYDVCARTILNGHSAAGLELHRSDDRHPVGPAPLYTKYIPKKHEYRVHCVKLDGENATFVQRKARRDGVDVNWQIRNLENGFVYIVAYEVPEDVIEQALKAFKKTGLDFGAVDVIWNDKRKRSYVLEINTAPGLEERTAQFYAENLRRRSALLHL